MIGDKQTVRQPGLHLKARLFVFFRGGNTQEDTGPGVGDRDTEKEIDRQAMYLCICLCLSLCIYVFSILHAVAASCASLANTDDRQMDRQLET